MRSPYSVDNYTVSNVNLKAWQAYIQYAVNHPEINNFTVFNKFAQMLGDGENFHVARYNDGEWVFMLRIQPHYNKFIVGNGHDPTEVVDISTKLYKILQSEPNYYIGVDSTTRALKGLVAAAKPQMQKELSRIKHLIYGDVFNAATVKYGLKALERPLSNRTVITVGPKHLENLSFSTRHISVPENNCWRQSDSIEAEVDRAIQAFSESNPVVIYACSLLSKLLLDIFYNKYGNQITQIDIGSCLDPWCGVRSRPWHDPIINYCKIRSAKVTASELQPSYQDNNYTGMKPGATEPVTFKNLHLGCGGYVIPNWDNLDIQSKAGVIKHDLTKRLPYPDRSVKYVFTEHFIEHLDEVDGFNLLKECYRVMVPGGKIRVTCPDLRQYVDAYLNWHKTNHDENFTSGANFLNYAILGEAKKDLKYMSPIQFSTDHGHRYYYDEQELGTKLKQVGFVNPVRCQYHQSNNPELRNLEKRLPTKDMIIEATKP